MHKGFSLDKGALKLDVITEADDEYESDDGSWHQPFYWYFNRWLGTIHEHKRERSGSFNNPKDEHIKHINWKYSNPVVDEFLFEPNLN